jgi:hypothetical protein
MTARTKPNRNVEHDFERAPMRYLVDSGADPSAYADVSLAECIKWVERNLYGLPTVIWRREMHPDAVNKGRYPSADEKCTYRIVAIWQDDKWTRQKDKCPKCQGPGTMLHMTPFTPGVTLAVPIPCTACGGSGLVEINA